MESRSPPTTSGSCSPLSIHAFSKSPCATPSIVDNSVHHLALRILSPRRSPAALPRSPALLPALLPRGRDEGDCVVSGHAEVPVFPFCEV